MDAFSYLSVLLSIILGLSITQILKGFRGLMLARSHVRVYWPCLLWAILLLVIDVQSWWAMYELRHYKDWTFLAFAIVLAQTIPLYLLAGLVLPDIRIESPVDLRTHYYDNHRWFFVLAALLCVISISKVLMLFGEWPPPLDLGFQVVFITVSLIAAWTARESYHERMAPIAAIGIGAYIGLLFAHLR
ncbi:MAG: hypothetical protein ABIS07_11820 [Dokdonella sp.]